jgi:hypothetical protein
MKHFWLTYTGKDALNIRINHYSGAESWPLSANNHEKMSGRSLDGDLIRRANSAQAHPGRLAR